jgi:hypothetical protein
MLAMLFCYVHVVKAIFLSLWQLILIIKFSSIFVACRASSKEIYDNALETAEKICSYEDIMDDTQVAYRLSQSGLSY